MQKTTILFVLTLIFITNSCFSQIVKSEAFEVAFSTKINGKWSELSRPQLSNIKIILNKTDKLITIYSQKKQVYRLKEIIEEPSTSNNVTIFKFSAVDQYGRLCTIRQFFKEVNGTNWLSTKLYVIFKNIFYVYNLVAD